jgi:hypothetical protein
MIPIGTQAYNMKMPGHFHIKCGAYRFWKIRIIPAIIISCIVDFFLMSSVSDIFPFLLLAVTLIGAAVHITLERNTMTRQRAAEVLLMWFFAIEVGIGGIWAFIGHTVFAAQVAESIGWPAGNPFQAEVALTNLAFGVLGFLSIKISGSFRLATIIGYAIFMVGAGVGHVYQLFAFGDTAMNNAGPLMYLDFIIPGVLIVLYLMSGQCCRDKSI